MLVIIRKVQRCKSPSQYCDSPWGIETVTKLSSCGEMGMLLIGVANLFSDTFNLYTEQERRKKDTAFYKPY